MSYTNGWFAAIRSLLELLYFASGIAIAVAAFWGLKQLRISKQIARTNARREAFKLAADECRFYAKEVVPLANKFATEYKQLGLTCLSGPSQFRIEKGEIVGHSFPVDLLQKEIPKIAESLVECLNAVEAFALFFTSGVADDDLGFQETAISFCKLTAQHMGAYFHMRHINAARYESTIKLFEIWQKRLQANAASLAMKPLGDLIRTVGKERIRPIGTED